MYLSQFRIPMYTPFEKLAPKDIVEFIMIIRPGIAEGDRDFIQECLIDRMLDNTTAMKVIKAFRIPRGGLTVTARNNRILQYVGLPPRHRSDAGFTVGVATGLALAGIAAAVVGQFAG